ncbi:MAG: hypothetical protein BMS9Abin36_0956 [Gammaproteobacteria bacterium]|nr:MAG: hypothetical protein BMS9Abin36_0956 [Gammaproteobacteria bacterium]
MSTSATQQTILAKKEALAASVGPLLSRLGQQCAEVWPEPDAIDRVILDGINTIPNCHLMYAWDVNGIEISSMIMADKADRHWRGRDLSQRPYLKNNLPFKGIMLSSVYHSQYTHKQCITALQAVSLDDKLLGFIAADFAVTDLLYDSELIVPERRWQQFRGDPAVRGTVFMQERVQSTLDEHIDAVTDLICDLMIDHGIFHTKIHFSSGRCSFWLLDDPYNYRIHGVDEIINPELCLAYPLHPFPKEARTTPEKIRQVFTQFKALRFADETIYLRSASINIMNGMLGLTFSCDGSHYMPIDEFLDRDLVFWIGSLGKQASA